MGNEFERVKDLDLEYATIIANELLSKRKAARKSTTRK
jgi:hypothetical protein